MFIIVLTLLLTYMSYAYVDYWGIYKEKQQLKKETKPKKEFDVRKYSSIPDVELEKRYEKKSELLLKDSIKWYDEKIKNEKPPVIYLFYKHPEKYHEAYWKWIKWEQGKINKTIRYAVAHSRVERANVRKDYQEILKELRQKGYEILYFYRPDCPYCQAMDKEFPFIEDKIKIHKINVYKDPEMAERWNVKLTPTLILVSPVEKKAFRIEGYRTAMELIYEFYDLYGNAR